MKELRIVRGLIIVIAVLAVVSIVPAAVDMDWARIGDKTTILFLCVTVWFTSKTADHYRERA